VFAVLNESVKNIINGATFEGCFTQEQLGFIVRAVTQEAKTVLGDKLKEVILYGSYARGDYHDWSDVDIMFLLNVDDQLTVQKLCKDVDEALSELIFEMDGMLSTIAVPHSRFEYMKEYYPFYGNIDREGVRVYA
jgi:predicted nucleotidyltransferase